MRKSLIKVFRDFSDEYQLRGDRRVVLSSVKSFFKTIDSFKQDARNESREHLSDFVNDIKFCIAGLGFLAMYIELGKQERLTNIVLRQDFSAKDTFLYAGLANIVNTSISIVDLSMNGFDSQARMLLRSLDEYALKIPVLFSCADDFNAWHQAQEMDVSKQAHYELFAKKQALFKKYQKLEKECFSEAHFTEIEDLKYSHDFYSMFVHGASIASSIGAYAFDFEKDNVLPNIFGRASIGSISTLQSTLSILLRFSMLIRIVLLRFHNWNPKPTNESDEFLLMYLACFDGVVQMSREFFSEE